MTGNDNPEALASAINRQLEALAVEGDWLEVADALTRRDALLARVPAAERKAALLSARRCTDRLQTLASAAKTECAGELAALKRGRKAMASYRANDSAQVRTASSI